MRILIVGLPKSGTTILTYRIAAALDGVTIEFEPLGGPDPNLSADHVVTKKLVGDQTAGLEEFSGYDRRIWISRDPRDFLVSQTLYRWHREVPPEEGDQVWFERIVALIEAKEAAPDTVAFDQLEPADYGPTFDAVADLWATDGGDGWFLYRYEDMVAGRYDALNGYLGFDVDPEASVASGLERVVRRKGMGDWRHWFTPADVARYAAGSMAAYMVTFGYDHDDWALDPSPHIDPAHGSSYVTSLFNDHANGETDSDTNGQHPAGQDQPDGGPEVDSPEVDGPTEPVVVDGTARRALRRLRARAR